MSAAIKPDPIIVSSVDFMKIKHFFPGILTKCTTRRLESGSYVLTYSDEMDATIRSIKLKLSSIEHYNLAHSLPKSVVDKAITHCETIFRDVVFITSSSFAIDLLTEVSFSRLLDAVHEIRKYESFGSYSSTPHHAVGALSQRASEKEGSSSNATGTANLPNSKPNVRNTSRGSIHHSAMPNFEFKLNEKIKVKIYEGDLLEAHVDVIVNAANEDLMNRGGIAYVIAQACGQKLHTECQRIIQNEGKLKVTDVKSTSAGKLHFGKVLHAVGPCWDDYTDKEACLDDLQKTIQNILEAADETPLCRRVGIPAISSGMFSFRYSLLQ